jgi:hypothetical protein
MYRLFIALYSSPGHRNAWGTHPGDGSLSSHYSNRALRLASQTHQIMRGSPDLPGLFRVHARFAFGVPTDGLLEPFRPVRPLHCVGPDLRRGVSECSVGPRGALGNVGRDGLISRLDPDRLRGAAAGLWLHHPYSQTCFRTLSLRLCW